MLIGFLYFVLYFGIWLFVMNHLSSIEGKDSIMQIISIVITIFLLYTWLISAKSLSFILDRMLDKSRRNYENYLRRKYSNLSRRELYDKMWEYQRPLSSFSPISPDYERGLKRQDISNECRDILKIREQDQLIGYLKSNIFIWIAISVIAFYLGYVW